MKKRLKHQPPFIQLIILGSITVGFFFLSIILVSPLIIKLYGVSFESFATIDYTKPGMIGLMKLLQTILSVVIFLFPALAFALLADTRPLHFIGFRKPVPASFYLVAIVTILASVPIVAWIGELNQHIHLPAKLKGLENWIRTSESDANELVKKLLEMKSKADLVLMVFILGVVPAVVEEVFFRGVLQRIFIQITRRPWTGIILTAVIFSAVHGQFLGFFPRAVLGLILGALFWFSGSIWPGIFAHFINNAMQIVFVFLNPKFADVEPNFSAVIVTVSAIALTGLLWWMVKHSQTSYAEVYDNDDDFMIGTKDQYIA